VPPNGWALARCCSVRWILFATVRYNQTRLSIDSDKVFLHAARRLRRMLAGILIVMAIFLVI
jgi:hypothetical protein